MKTSWIIAIIVIIVLVIGFVWIGSMSPSTPIDTSVPTGTESSPVLKVVPDQVLGEYLVASNNMTLYLFTKDSTGTSTCYDACAVNWPPYSPVATGAVTVGQGVSAADISAISRADGSVQMTYKGMPLYFYVNDMKVGDTIGQNVGGVWFVVKP